MIERINGFVARRFGGVGTTVGSFVRIHVWAIAFLVVISLVLPTRAGKLDSAPGFPSQIPLFSSNASKILQRLTLDGADQRAFRKSPFGKQRFRIAWIAGSEGAVYPPDHREGTYLAALAAKVLPKIDGRRVGIDLYAMPGIRLADIYFALLDAIKSKPDMIVIALNPVWVLNPVATHQWTQLDSKAANILIDKPPSWPLAASMLSPSDLVWGWASAHLKAVDDRASYSDDLQNLVKDLGPLDRSKLAEATKAQTPDRTQQVLSESTLAFWFEHRLHEPRASGPDSWAKWIAESNKGESALNDMLLRAIAQELRAAKIPSYVYLAQVNSGWLTTNNAVESAVGGVEHQLVDMRGSFASENILYQPITASRFVQPLVFRPGDPVHMQAAAAMGPYLAEQLCTLVAKTGHHANCPNVNGGAGNG
jgi:hypothetical protein